MITELLVLGECIGMISRAFSIDNISNESCDIDDDGYSFSNKKYKVEVYNSTVENKRYSWFIFYRKKKYTFWWTKVKTLLVSRKDKNAAKQIAHNWMITYDKENK